MVCRLNGGGDIYLGGGMTGQGQWRRRGVSRGDAISYGGRGYVYAMEDGGVRLVDDRTGETVFERGGYEGGGKSDFGRFLRRTG